MSKIKFLLDANLSPETAEFLRSLGYEALSLIEEQKGELDDEIVVERARTEGWVILTFDLDFGEIYFFAENKQFSVITFRLQDQRVEALNPILEKFLTTHGESIAQQTKHYLAIVTEHQIRISD